MKSLFFAAVISAGVGILAWVGNQTIREQDKAISVLQDRVAASHEGRVEILRLKRNIADLESELARAKSGTTRQL